MTRPELERRAAELQDEPWQRHRLHPDADQAADLAEPVAPIVRVAHRGQARDAMPVPEASGGDAAPSGRRVGRAMVGTASREAARQLGDRHSLAMLTKSRGSGNPERMTKVGCDSSLGIGDDVRMHEAEPASGPSGVGQGERSQPPARGRPARNRRRDRPLPCWSASRPELTQRPDAGGRAGRTRWTAPSTQANRPVSPIVDGARHARAGRFRRRGRGGVAERLAPVAADRGRELPRSVPGGARRGPHRRRHLWRDLRRRSRRPGASGPAAAASSATGSSRARRPAARWSSAASRRPSWRPRSSSSSTRDGSSLDDSVRRCPARRCARSAGEITIRQLLDHTSGLADVFNDATRRGLEEHPERAWSTRAGAGDRSTPRGTSRARAGRTPTRTTTCSA